MSHDHGHAIPETPKTSSSAAFFAVLIFVGFILGLVNFTQSMGHSADGHATGAHAPAHGEHAAPAHEAHSTPAHEEHASPAESHNNDHEATNSDQSSEHH